MKELEQLKKSKYTDNFWQQCTFFSILIFLYFLSVFHPKILNIIGTGATKLDSLKDELEEAESKVEQCRDHLAAEMFQLMSRETELAQIIIQYVKLQRAYHESALHCLEDLIPGLESYISKSILLYFSKNNCY